MLCAPHFSTRLYAEWCKPVFFSKKKRKKLPIAFSVRDGFFFFWLHWCCLYPFFSTTWDVQKKDQLRFSFSYRRLLLTTLWTARRCKFVCVLSLLHLLFPFITFWEALHNFTRTRSGWWLFFFLLFSLPPPMPVYSHTFLFPFFIFSIWKSLCHVYWYTCKTEKRRKVIWKVCSEWSRLFLNIGTYTPFRLCQFSFLFFSDVSYSDTLAFFFLLQSSSVSLLFFFSQVVYDGSFCFVWSPTLLFFLYCIFFFF